MTRATERRWRSALVVVGVLVLALAGAGCEAGTTARPGSSGQPSTQPSAQSSAQSPVQSSVPSSPLPSPGPALASRTEFRVASFNVLGAHHTRPGATGPHIKKMAVSAVRSRLALRALAVHGVGLVGLQEFEPPQLRQWQRLSHGQWRFHPGLTRGERSLARSVAWRDDTWELVRAKVFTFPYFKGSPREAPSVVLRHRASGQLIGMINAHNPANTRRFGDNSSWRRKALAIQTREIRSLRKQGLPVVVTGDFNAVGTAYCTLTQRAGLVAAIDVGEGGTGQGGRTSPCRAPKGAGVDWVFGSPELTFLSHQRARGSLVRRASDHPIVVAAALFPAP